MLILQFPQPVLHLVVDAVAGYANGTMSLGYTYKYYVDRLYKSPDIKILKVNGIMPSDGNVRNNSYAFIAPYNAVIRSTDADEVGGKFFKLDVIGRGTKMYSTSRLCKY
jgi:phosphate transport system substrate-binding protein